MVSKGPIILGIGAAIAAAGLLFRKGKPSEATPEDIPGETPEETPEETPGEVPGNTVTVSLKNPPPGATMWSVSLMDRDVNQIQEATLIREASGKDRLNIDEVAVFDIPSGTQFPLYILMLQITKWNADQTALTSLYEMQSYRPYQYDFATSSYTGAPDPSYRNMTIPDYGAFYLEPK